jgi:hypothetical protein
MPAPLRASNGVSRANLIYSGNHAVPERGEDAWWDLGTPDWGAGLALRDILKARRVRVQGARGPK